MKTFILACSVCFGDPASPLTRGATLAVLFMIGVVGLVLGGIAAVGLIWMHRARKLEAASSSAP